jgi:hypothetical protein
MNRRGFLSLSLLAPVAGAMAARDAMAAPQVRTLTGLVSRNAVLAGEGFIGEGWAPLRRKIIVEVETFGVDKIAPAIPARPAEDESVSAQFESDLAFLQGEPGVAI